MLAKNQEELVPRKSKHSPTNGCGEWFPALWTLEFARLRAKTDDVLPVSKREHARI